MNRMIRLAFSTVLCATLLASPTAFAHPIGPDAPYVVRVEGEDGRRLRTFHHEGQTYVLGAWGERYVIRIENRTGRRVEAVVSVDGRDAVSGRVGDYVRERGYLINPWDEVVIEGFRKSFDEVAAFRFSDPQASYSSRMGTPENVGIIGVAFFPEAQRRVPRPYPLRPYSRRDRAPVPMDEYSDDGGYHRGSYGPQSGVAPASPREERAADSLGTMGSASPEGAAAKRKSGGPSTRGGRTRDAYTEAEAPEASRQNLGTEYGESLDSRVREVAFRRASERHPAQVVTLRYDDRAGLLARGIRIEPRRPIAQHEPLAFPGRRFAPPPP
jgi:hypothetical protein